MGEEKKELTFEEEREEFYGVVEKAIENYAGVLKINKNCGKVGEDVQYYNCIYWRHINIISEKKKKEVYSNVTGMNIMPYSITREIVEKADSNVGKSFKEEIKKDENYCDYDDNKTSGNFHKKPDGNMQIVLTEGTLGPGKSDSFPENPKPYYFPPIDNPKDIFTTDDLKSEIERVLKEIFEE